jgi:hypothetical protein
LVSRNVFATRATSAGGGWSATSRWQSFAEGVQLHQFSRVVLIERAAARAGVVEIEKHGRRLCGREQQLFERAPDARADRVALVARHEKTIERFAGEDIEVIHPEIDHHFVELPFRLRRADDALGRKIHDGAAPLAASHRARFLARRHLHLIRVARDARLDLRVVGRRRMLALTARRQRVFTYGLRRRQSPLWLRMAGVTAPRLASRQ